MDTQNTLDYHMNKVSEIVDLMESPDISLDETMNLYKEAKISLNFCTEYLNKAKLTFEQLEIA
ncbi:MAG: exodeoxyribonuclease VII small subunit [Bacteroidota bacterium]|nr:exodeoxyribonuclease VII small subunit [Bacteroidota bacterium]